MAYRAQVARDADFGAGSLEGDQTFLQKVDGFGSPTIEQHRASDMERATGLPERKPLLRPDRQFFLSCFHQPFPEPAVLIEEGAEVDGMCEAERVAEGSSEFTHLTIDLERLLRVAEVP